MPEVMADENPQQNKALGRAYVEKVDSSVANLFNRDRPKQAERPSGVDLHTLISNASQFVKFLKPFTVLEKKIAKARDRMSSADQALDALYSKRAQLLDKSLAE